jgi:hypothetical protein
MYKVPSNTIRNFFNCFTTQFNTHVRILTVQKRCQNYGRWIWILWFHISNIWPNIHAHTHTHSQTPPPRRFLRATLPFLESHEVRQIHENKCPELAQLTTTPTPDLYLAQELWRIRLAVTFKSFFFCFNHTVLVFCDFSPSKGPINLICVDGWFHGCSTGSFRVQSCSSNSRWFLFIMARGLRRTHYCDATQIVHIPNRVFFFTSVIL